MDKLVADLKRILEDADPGITVAETLRPEPRQDDVVEPALPIPEEKRRLT